MVGRFSFYNLVTLFEGVLKMFYGFLLMNSELLRLRNYFETHLLIFFSFFIVLGYFQTGSKWSQKFGCLWIETLLNFVLNCGNLLLSVSYHGKIVLWSGMEAYYVCLKKIQSKIFKVSKKNFFQHLLNFIMKE